MALKKKEGTNNLKEILSKRFFELNYLTFQLIWLIDSIFQTVFLTFLDSL